MDDDFNTAAAIGHLYGGVRAGQQAARRAEGGAPRTSAAGRWPGCGEDLAACGETLGIFQRPPAAFLDGYRLRLCARRGIDPAAVEARIAERTAARAAKDFARADEIRRALQESGVELMDTPAGTTWRVVRAALGAQRPHGSRNRVRAPSSSSSGAVVARRRR